MTTPPIQILVTATLTVSYALMIDVSFFGCRLRVLQLTKGKGNAPEWVQLCMYFRTYSVLSLTFIVCIIPLFTGEAIGVGQKTGDIPADTRRFKNRICAACFTALGYPILITLYGGAIAIVYGSSIYEPPEGTCLTGLHG